MSKHRRTKRFGLALSTPEREGLRYLAKLEGMAEADVLRLAINDLPPDGQQAIGCFPPGAIAPNRPSQS